MKKIILIAIILLLTGCYDYNELTDLGIVSSMFIDYKDNEYTVNIELLDTNKKVSSPSYFITGCGNTFDAALNDLYTKTTKHIYLNHINAVVISKSFASSHLSELYDYFVRAPYIRKDSYFFLTEDINQFINAKTKDNMAIGESLKNTLEYSYEDYGYYKTSDYNTILNSFLNNKTYLLGSVSLIDETITLDDVYLVKNDDLSFKIDHDVLLLETILSGDAQSFTIINNNTFEAYKSKVKKIISKNKIILEFNFDIRLKNIINTDINTNEEKQKQERILNKYLTNLFEKSIEYSKEVDSDIYNFNYYYYLKYPNLVKENTFKSINYEIIVKTKINEKGLLIGTRNE